MRTSAWLVRAAGSVAQPHAAKVLQSPIDAPAAAPPLRPTAGARRGVRSGRSAGLDLAHRTEAVMRRVDVDDLRLRGHEVGRGGEERLHVRLLDVGGTCLSILEALDADELVLIGKAPGELEEQAAVLGVDVLGVGIGQCQPLVHLVGPDRHLDVDQDHATAPLR